MPIKHKRTRRMVGGVLVVCGALLMWLAPDYTAAGAVLLGAGIALELAGIALERSSG